MFMENKYEDAIKEFQKSISLDPWSEQGVLSKIGIADAYFAKNDYQRALAEYKRLSLSLDFQSYVLYRIVLCYNILKNEGEFEISKEKLIKKYSLSLESTLIKEIQRFDITSKQVPVKVCEDTRAAGPSAIPSEPVWTIQVGSFTKEENARNLSATLIKKGYISWIQPVRIGDGFFYRVYLGKFKAEEEVKKKAEEIGRKENLPARILELK